MSLICSVCGTLAEHRCARCKLVMYCSVDCQRHDWVHGGHRQQCSTTNTNGDNSKVPHSLTVALPAPIFHVNDLAAALECIHRQGWAIVRVDAGVVQQLQTFSAQWRAFFAQATRVKDAFRTPSLRGTYMTPKPGLHEVFEYKRVGFDPAFKVPSNCAATTLELFQWFEELALRMLRCMLERASSATWKWRNEDFVPESTLRILHYDGALPSNPVKLLEQIWPAHTDSSLITIAPRSTLPALEMKRFDTGEWVCPEDFMGEEHMAVFMGDSGAYLTNNYFPSPIHRPGAARMVAEWRPGGQARMSTPFFLRGVAETVLCPAKVVPGCELPPLTVSQLDDNVGLCRDRMPWKLQLPYYASMQYSM